MTNARKPSGFTLVELMITIAVLGILLVVGVPSYQNFITRNLLVTQNNTFVANLQSARSEAVKRRARVALLAAGGGGGNEWGNGWQLFVDANNNNALDGGETVLRIQGALEGNNTLDSTNGTTLIAYLPNGFVNSAGDLTFNLCHDSGEEGRQVLLSITGRVTLDNQFVCP